METPLSVCAVALAACGQEALSDPDEDSPAGDRCREHADHVTRLVLRRAPWNAGERVATLVARTDITQRDFAYSYDVPGGDADAVRVWKVEGCQRWRRRGRILVADGGPTIEITYCAFPRPEDWTPELIELCGQELGRRLAPLFARSASDREIITDAAYEAAARAHTIDGGEQSASFLRPTSWLTARR